MVDKLVLGATPKVRNQIAGYITHVFVGAQAVFSGETAQEE